jgi:hypothetical protein
MDPVTVSLAPAIMGVLVPYAKKGAESFVSSAGKDAYEKTKAILETLKKRWSGDKEATETLEHFEEKPDRYKSAVEDILNEKLAHDKGLSEELQKILNDIGPDLEIIQKMKTAEDVTGLEADEIAKGTVKITQDIEQAKNVTGAKVKHIG